jgi:transcriptional regulator with XRE-family HTH domain
MFWERFYSLCEKSNIKPNPLAESLKISSGALTKWKNGSIPNGETLIKIANFFDCSVDYLLGRTDDPDSHKEKYVFEVAARGNSHQQAQTNDKNEIEKDFNKPMDFND